MNSSGDIEILTNLFILFYITYVFTDHSEALTTRLASLSLSLHYNIKQFLWATVSIVKTVDLYIWLKLILFFIKLVK